MLNDENRIAYSATWREKKKNLVILARRLDQSKMATSKTKCDCPCHHPVWETKKNDGLERTPPAQWKSMDPVNTHKDTFEVIG